MSGISIGDTPVTGIYYGSTPIKSVYKGSTKIWPSYTDAKAIHFDAAYSQYAAKANPSFMSDTAGAIRVYAEIDSLLSANGAATIFSVGSLSSANCLTLEFFRNTSLPSTTATYIGARFYNGTGYSSYAPTVAVAGTRYGVVFNSDGSLYINGALVSAIAPSGVSLIPSGSWINGLGGVNRTLSFGSRINSVIGSFLTGQANNGVYYNRALTSTEAIALSDPANMSLDPALVSSSSASAIVSRWDFESDAADAVGGNDLTLASSDMVNHPPTYVDI